MASVTNPIIDDLAKLEIALYAALVRESRAGVATDGKVDAAPLSIIKKSKRRIKTKRGRPEDTRP